MATQELTIRYPEGLERTVKLTKAEIEAELASDLSAIDKVCQQAQHQDGEQDT